MSTYNGALPIAIPVSDGAPEGFAGEGIGLFESLRIALDALLARRQQGARHQPDDHEARHRERDT